jgi:hypothetical protein
LLAAVQAADASFDRRRAQLFEEQVEAGAGLGAFGDS